MAVSPAEPPVFHHSFPPETLGALRAMNRAFARVVIENHRLALPVIQLVNGQAVETPTSELLPQALAFLATNGEPLAEQVGAAQ